MVTYIQKSAAIELIGIDEAVAQNQYSASVELPLAPHAPAQGELLDFEFISSGGDILTPAGRLLVMSADPGSSAGDTAITVAQRRTVLGEVPVAAADWQSDSNGGSVQYPTRPITIPGQTSVFLVWFHSDATGYNSASGDDEILEVRVGYRAE